MNSKHLKLALAALLLPLGNSFAGPFDSQTVPAEADWYLHVNLDQLSAGKLGEWMAQRGQEIEAKPGEKNPLDFFSGDGNRVSGGMTVYGSVSAPEDAVLRATGLNDHEAVLAQIRKSKEYQKSEINDFTVHSWVEGSKGNLAGKPHQVYGVFLDDSTMIATQSMWALTKALDFHGKAGGGVEPPAKLNAAILGKANLQALHDKAEAQVFRFAKCLESSMSVDADGSISGNLRLEAADAESARKMYRMIDGMLAFGAEAAEPGAWNPDDHLKVHQVGDLIEIKLNLPISALEKLMDFYGTAAGGVDPFANTDAAILGKANLQALREEAEAQVFRFAKNLELSSMSVDADGSVSGSYRLKAPDAERAGKMYRVIDGMLAFGANGGWNPDDHVEVQHDGNTIEFNLNLPISALEKLKDSQWRFPMRVGE